MFVDSLRKEKLVIIAAKPKRSSSACCADVCAVDKCTTKMCFPVSTMLFHSLSTIDSCSQLCTCTCPMLCTSYCDGLAKSRILPTDRAMHDDLRPLQNGSQGVLTYCTVSLMG